MDTRILGISFPYRVKLSLRRSKTVSLDDTVWGVPFDAEKGYSAGSPVSENDIVINPPEGAKSCSTTIGSAFTFSVSEIAFTSVVTIIAILAIIFGVLFSSYLIYAGLAAFLLGFVGDTLLSRFIIGFFYGISHYELLPNRYFPTKAMSRFVWYSQIVGVPSIFSIVGACFSVYFGWGVALLWIIASALFSYALAATSNQVISARHFDANVSELSYRMAGFVAYSVGFVISASLSFFLFSTLAEILAYIFIDSPSSFLAILLVFPLQLLAPTIMKFRYSVIYPVMVATTIACVILATSIPIPLNALTNAFNLSFLSCVDAAANAETCLLGKRQFWVIVVSALSILMAQLPSRFTQIGRNAANAYFLLIYVILGIIAFMLDSNRGNLVPVFTRVTTDLPAIPFVFATVALGTLTGLLNTNSHECSTRYISKPLDARFYGYITIMVDCMYAVFAVLIVASFFSLQVFLSWNTTVAGGLRLFVTALASSFFRSFNFQLQAGISLGYAVLAVNAFNTMESLSRSFYRAVIMMANRESPRVSPRFSKSYPDLISSIKSFYILAISILFAASVVILSYSGQLKDLWMLAGIYSMSYVAFLLLMSGFYSKLLTDARSRSIIFCVLGAAMTGLQLYVAIKYVKLLISSNGFNLRAENSLWWIILINTGICCSVGGFLTILVFQLLLFSPSAERSRFVRGNRILRRVGFFTFPHDAPLI